MSGQGYSKLYMGSGKEASAADFSDYIGFSEDKEGAYTYTVPVEALDKALACAGFSKRKEQWYSRVILFHASSLPKDALLVSLPDYDKIELALRAYKKTSDSAAAGSENPSDADVRTNGTAEAITIDKEDGEYSIEVSLTGGSGKSTVNSPTILTVNDKKAYARIQWSSSNYDYMIVGNQKFLNIAEEGADSVFEIPITAMDTEIPVIADTTAMGTPHEVTYTLTFYSESIGSKSQMPQEAAKRVVAVAVIIIVGGGILNHFANKRKRV